MWASGNQLERDADKEAKEKANGVRRFINLAAKKRKEKLGRKAAPPTQ